MHGTSIGRRDSVICRLIFTAALAYWLAVATPAMDGAPPVAASDEASSRRERVVLPEPIPDPIEPFNRLVWAFNNGLMSGVIKPTAKVYRFIVCRPLRQGIQNFGRNITYPGRLINNLLQARWAGARDESYRFGCNTVLGLGGFFDVASKFDIPKWDTDFGETFGQWGWKPQWFIMLPLFGPSNERDTVGLAADTAANPLTYLSPYRFESTQPLTYVGPYSYASYVVTYNNLSDSVDQFVRFSRTEKDAYSELAYAWTYVRERRAADYRVDGPLDQASLETLQAVNSSLTDPEFPGRGKTRAVLIPTTGKQLKFNLWLQAGRAPLVYIVPGLGSHRLTLSALAMAELLFKHGYSAVCVSSPFNYEFMENASTAAVPAYTAVDACDLQVALAAIQNQLEKTDPGRISAKALLGYSMGAFHSLFMAADGCDAGPASIQFDRYVAINSPVRLIHATAKLDEFFQAPLAWPAEERTRRIENTFLKVSALSQNTNNPSSLSPQTPPFSAIESQFLVGAAFRLILRDAIFSSQERTNLGVLQHSIHSLRREPLYREILQFSFQDYYEKSVIPYYQRQAPEVNMAQVLAQTGNLRNYAAGLQANPKVRLIGNRNDFLLDKSDLEWLQSTFAPDRLTLFETGGHLGNLSHPEMQKAILEALAGLGD